MVQDAYNHPSVVIYSIGNEIPEDGGVKGVRVGKEIVDAIHALDTTRPTTLCPSVHWLREYLFLGCQRFSKCQSKILFPADNRIIRSTKRHHRLCGLASELP